MGAWGKWGVAAVLCAAPVACAGAHRSVAEAALPANWDDRLIDAAREGGAGLPVLAVLPFERGSATGDLRIADLVTTALAQSGRVVLVERAKIERVLDEQRLKLGGAIDDASKAADLGRLLGAEAVVFGAVTSATQQTLDHFAYDLVHTEVRIDARAVDTTTGRVVFSELGSGAADAKVVRSADGTVVSGLRDASGEYRRAAAQAAASLGRRITRLRPAVGLVLSVGPAGVVAAVGAGQGVLRAAEAVAFRPGRRLVHPVTGEKLGWEKRLLGALVVQSVEQQTALLLPRDESREPLRPGDVVVVRDAELP